MACPAIVGLSYANPTYDVALSEAPVLSKRYLLDTLAVIALYSRSLPSG